MTFLPKRFRATICARTDAFFAAHPEEKRTEPADQVILTLVFKRLIRLAEDLDRKMAQTVDAFFADHPFEERTPAAEQVIRKLAFDEFIRSAQE
jgi:hypothetical protein